VAGEVTILLKTGSLLGDKLLILLIRTPYFMVEVYEEGFCVSRGF
jgi:hypothetical protein